MSHRQARWVEILQSYKFKIKYRPEKTNLVANALSRKPETGLISTINIDSEFYKTIQEEYIKDEHLTNIIDALKDHNSNDAKRLKHLTY